MGLEFTPKFTPKNTETQFYSMIANLIGNSKKPDFRVFEEKFLIVNDC